MSALISSSRRAVLKLAAMASLPSSLHAEPVSPDEALIDLGRVWHLSAVRYDLACDLLCDADSRYECPPVPEALFRRPGDGHLFFGLRVGDHHTGRPWYGYADAIAEIRGRVCNRIGAIRLDDERIVPAVPNLPARRRRDQIVAAYDQWYADRAAAELACGLTDAKAANDAAEAENRELRRRIMTMPALTLAGVLVKVRVAAWRHGGSAEMTDWVDYCLEKGNLTGEAVAFNAVRDLVAMIERGSI